MFYCYWKEEEILELFGKTRRKTRNNWLPVQNSLEYLLTHNFVLVYLDLFWILHPFWCCFEFWNFFSFTPSFSRNFFMFEKKKSFCVSLFYTLSASFDEISLNKLAWHEFLLSEYLMPRFLDAEHPRLIALFEASTLFDNSVPFTPFSLSFQLDRDKRIQTFFEIILILSNTKHSYGFACFI